MGKRGALKACSVGMLGVGGACLVAFRIVGSDVDSGGVLREPFVLIPLGWLCIAGGLVLGVAYLLLRAKSDDARRTRS